MADVLFLSHRIPYPPDKGDKIRSWNLLKHLANRHAVHLGCFIDDPADEAHVLVLNALCASVHAVRIQPKLRKLCALRGLLKREALTFPFYRDGGLQRWSNARLANSPALALAYSSSMAPYLMGGEASTRKVIDFVDLDSQKWLDFARTRKGMMRWLYKREGETLAVAERALASQADMSLFVSKTEVHDFLKDAPHLQDRAAAVANGVDTDYFDPATFHDLPDPRLTSGPSLVFTGAMDYWPNVEAVCWYATRIHDRLRQLEPNLHLFIVGSKPAPEVRELAAKPGIVVTGRVADIRPWLAHATVMVAPLQTARGVQNKVLEAMAMGKAIVCSSAANDGIHGQSDKVMMVADHVDDIVDEVLRLVADQDKRERLGQAALSFVRDHFQWSAQLATFDRLAFG